MIWKWCKNRYQRWYTIFYSVQSCIKFLFVSNLRSSRFFSLGNLKHRAHSTESLCKHFISLITALPLTVWTKEQTSWTHAHGGRACKYKLFFWEEKVCVCTVFKDQTGWATEVQISYFLPLSLYRRDDQWPTLTPPSSLATNVTADWCLLLKSPSLLTFLWWSFFFFWFTPASPWFKL